MVSAIFVGLILLLLILQLSLFSRLCTYLAKQYPEEWAQATRTDIQGKASLSTNANLQQALHSGVFATLNDPKVQQFKRFKALNLIAVAAIALVQCWLAFSR